MNRKIRGMLSKCRKYLIAGSFLKHTTNYLVHMWSRFWKRLDYLLGILARKILYSHGDVQSNKIFVMTFDDRYTCNLKYIVDEILHQELPVEIVWVAPRKGKINRENYPEGVKLVRRGSYSMHQEQATAKVWLDNALSCVWYYTPKKANQVYINTWHGSMGIKKLSGNKGWLRRARRCNKLTDYCVTNSTFEENVFRDTFWRDVPCLTYGHPRNDILFKNELAQELREKVLRHILGCKEDLQDEQALLLQEESLKSASQKKLFLYAPTFRDTGRTDFKVLDYERLKIALEKRFGGEWIILVRTHFKDRAQKMSIQFNDWLMNASTYGDMQELLAVVDMGMTDYSSWAYDYILTKRPLFLYAPDLDLYDQGRGFYYPLESTPFPLAKDNDELETAILGFDESRYQADVNHFLADKGCYEDGHASRRVVEKLKEVMCLEPVEQVEQ